MNPKHCLENISNKNTVNSHENIFNPFDFQYILNNDENDADINFFNNKYDAVNSPYFSLAEVPCKVEKLLENSFSVYHINIRSLKKFFDKLLEFLSIMKNEFDIIAISETWCNDDNININSLYQIPNYTPIRQIRKTSSKGGGLVLYIHKTITFNALEKLSNNNEHIESLSVEIIRKNQKNIILSCIYRPPRRDPHIFTSKVKELVERNKQKQKPLILIGDLNLNSLDYAKNNHVQNFFNLAFENGVFPVINRPTRIPKTSETAIDHILTNTILDFEVHSGIIKNDISDHFGIFCVLKTDLERKSNNEYFLRRDISESNVKKFKALMNTVDWNLITQTLNPNDSYCIFIEKFTKISDQAFPLQKIKIKGKSLVSPWITKGIRKSSRKKQRLYEKFLKHKTTKTLETYKNYTNLFEKIKKSSKKHYYQNKLEKCKNNLKTTWKAMKEIIGKSKVFRQNLPNNLKINKKSITDKKIIADKFNEFFINLGPNLAAKIPPSNMNIDSYLPHVCTIFAEKSVTEEEFKKAFFSLKPNKTPGYDNINVNIVKKIYEELKTPLMRIFNLSLSTGIFPDKLKIAKVSPIFKNSEKNLLTNYRPISVLPCFSKILERIMYDRLYSYLTENKILFKKQFGFRSGHSTDHALLELIDQICECFDKKKYFLGIFVDLSKAFDTVNHKILIKKLENYGICGKNLLWFKSYLSNRKQYLEYKDNFNEQKTTNLLQIKCGVPQGSILGPLLF